MAIVFRLPSWTTEITVYRWDGTDYVEHTTLTGQIYTPYRGQDDPDQLGELWCEYPVENFDDIRDPVVSSLDRPDVVEFEFPAASDNLLRYYVLSKSPRWCGMVNAHCLSALSRVNPAIVQRPALVSTVETYHVVDFVTGATANGPVDCYISNRNQLDDFVISINVNFASADYALLRSKQVYPADPAEYDVFRLEFPADSSRYVYYKVLDSVPVNYSVPEEYVEAWGIQVTYDELATWFPGINTVDPWLLTVSGVTDGTCVFCSPLNTTDEVLPRTSPTYWTGSPFTWLCALTTSVRWVVYASNVPSPAYLYLELQESDYTALVYIQYAVDASDWDGVSDLTLTRTGGSDITGCTMPSTVTLGV